jgi:hypothetical protein
MATGDPEYRIMDEYVELKWLEEMEAIEDLKFKGFKVFGIDDLMDRRNGERIQTGRLEEHMTKHEMTTLQRIGQILHDDEAEVMVSNDAFDSIKAVYADEGFNIFNKDIPEEHLLFQGMVLIPEREWAG